MKDNTTMILAAVGLYEYFRQEVPEDELLTTLNKYQAEISEEIIDQCEDFVVYDSQVFYWYKKPVTQQERLMDILDEAKWNAFFDYSETAMDLIITAQSMIEEEK